MTTAVGAWRSRSLGRRIGYALLPGDGFSYLLHLRPREWPIMAAHTLLGLVIAVGLHPVTLWIYAPTAVAVLVIWVLLLNGGTLAFNSAFDADVDDVGYLDAPPPPPRYLALFGFALMLAGLLWSFAYPTPFLVAYALCFAMSILYSAPPARLKAVPGADWVINIVGFGALTPLAGWAITDRPMTRSALLIFVGFGALFAALYPLTQLYQLDADARRGDRTLAILLGARRSLAVSLLSAIVAFACFAALAAIEGARASRWLILGLALITWMAMLARWLTRASAMEPAEHKRGMYSALAAWVLSDVAVLALFA
ncbi:MAG: UbiA family prenyltransferase [Gemmatimonadota bacterium]|nr:UbiA family prenyltransferase [Gemmatimonadota bacterium]